MPFVLQTILEHGTKNPIVARLSLQIHQILNQCDIDKETQERIGEIYLNSLQKKLLRCWEIKSRYDRDFDKALQVYRPSRKKDQVIEVPHISRLDEECHNFLYEAKNFIRDLLEVWNLLYGTGFSSAREFLPNQKKGQSVIDFAVNEFGAKDGKTLFLQQAVECVDCLISLRNAVEHPGGYSGELRIQNFTRQPDGNLREPTWSRKVEGKLVYGPCSIRVDMETAIENFLTLGEDIVVSWAMDNLKVPSLMRLVPIPPEERDSKCPIKWVVTVHPGLVTEVSRSR